MKTSNDGFQQCYNAQVAVDGAHQLVVATEVTANASDQGGVPALLDALAETVGEQPETVLADAGYSNERDLADLETRGIDGYVSLGREGKAARPRDPEKYPATSRMAEKLSRPAGRAAPSVYEPWSISRGEPHRRTAENASADSREQRV